MRRTFLFGGALAALVSAPALVMADDAAVATGGTELLADATLAGDVDAGTLIGEEVYDANGDKVGEIDSVMVNTKGKVNAVVIDVSGWLQSEKLVAVPWKDLKTDTDGKVVTSITKDAATAATTYTYKDPALRKQVLTESGDRYEGATAGTADGAAPAVEMGTSLTNGDGSLNASKLIGLDVKSADDDKVGDIGEVVLDKGGQVQGVVVDVGGFLGIGTHPVLLSWKDVTLSDQDGKAAAMVNLSKERLEQLPAFESSSR